MEAIKYSKRNRIVTAVLSSLAPGLAQLHTAQPKKAATIFGTNLVILIISKSKLALTVPWLYPFLLLIIMLIWLFALMDGVIYARKERPITWFTRWYSELTALLIYICLAVLIGALSPAQAFKIPTASMAPALLLGDRIFVDRTAFTANPPQRGDIAVFRYPKDPNINYIKRIIGLPGDKILFRDKKLFLNDKEIPLSPVADPKSERAIAEGWFESDDVSVLSIFEEDLGSKHLVAMNVLSAFNSDFGPIIVPDRSYFTLGDNRDRSSDSRIWGSVPADNLIGKPAIVWFSFNAAKTSVRWDRIGKKLE